jgi:FkbM family methyltransferase
MLRSLYGVIRPHLPFKLDNTILGLLSKWFWIIREIRFFWTFKDKHLFQLRRKSKSQLRQDLFVLFQLNFKTDGFFVEFGATNGVDLSNSHILEHEFHWNGILAEPNQYWIRDLRDNRTCHIEDKCVWSKSNESLEFNSTAIPELATINDFSLGDGHERNRVEGTRHYVTTISLVDMLDKYRAPRIIDYLSIDTEGSELAILKGFDFSKYAFRVITCEHNFTPNREEIFRLLTSHGYQRVHHKLSHFDDWYVLNHGQV